MKRLISRRLTYYPGLHFNNLRSFTPLAMKCIFGLIGSLFLIHAELIAQQPLIKLPVSGPVDNIQGMMINDDMFVSIRAAVSGKASSTKSYFIHPDGREQEVDLHAADNKLLLAGVRDDSTTYFYFLDELDKLPIIRCIIVDETGKSRLYARSTAVPGRIYGSFIEGSDLFILCALQNSFTLQLIQLQKGRVVNEKNFGLSFDLGKRKESNVTFVDASIPTTPKQASSATKITKDKDVLWITIDEPIGEYDFDLPASAVFKTTVIKLDLNSTKTTIKAFFETERFPFTSAIFNGNLYRMVQGKKSPRIDLFNFESGKKVRTSQLLRGTEPGRDSTYARIGKYLRTEKDVKGAMIIKRVAGSLFIVDTLSSTQDLLTVGHYGDQMITGNWAPGPSVLQYAFALGAQIINDVTEGRYSCVYSYYVGSMEKGYTATYKTPLLQQVLDEYENKFIINGIRFEYRGYVTASKTTYAIYQKRKSPTLEILKFEL